MYISALGNSDWLTQIVVIQALWLIVLLIAIKVVQNHPIGSIKKDTDNTPNTSDKEK